MIVPGQQQVDPRVGDRVQRQLLPPDRLAQFGPVADRKREQRMVRDQDPRRVGRARANVSRMKATCSSLIRPSLKVSERAVLIPSTAAPGSSWKGHSSRR